MDGNLRDLRVIGYCLKDLLGKNFLFVYNLYLQGHKSSRAFERYTVRLFPVLFVVAVRSLKDLGQELMNS